MNPFRRRSSVQPDLNGEILAGVEFRIQYLGSGELSQAGGTDQEIARIIHDIHCLYAEQRNGLKKAREVVVFIDTQRINISSKNEDEDLINFPLTQVKDVTTCLDERPYSKTCVLVAREDHEPLYKAYVFFCKTERMATQFYQVASLAFQVGFILQEKYCGPQAEVANNESEDNVDSSCFKEENIKEDVSGIELMENQNGSCSTKNDVSHEESTSANTSWKTGPILSYKKRINERKVTFTFGNESNDDSTSLENDQQLVRINVNLGTGHREESQSKMGVYFDSAVEQERPEFLLSRWFRSSCRNLRKYFHKDPTTQEDEHGEIETPKEQSLKRRRPNAAAKKATS